MRDVGFDEDFSDRVESKMLVERNRLGLGVETEDLASLPFRFSNNRVHESRTESLSAFGGQHSS